MLLRQVQTFARYNRWANAGLLAAISDLDEAAYRGDRGLFFGSIHGTLNHLLVADRLWFRRITQNWPSAAPAELDALLFDDRSELALARACEDVRIVAFADELDEAALASTLAYRNVAGDEFRQPVADVLAHVFNHQTHHRGQIHAALTGLGDTAPPLDLIYFLRERS